MCKAKVYHILVETEELAAQLEQQIDSLASFQEVAREYSQCPSARGGGYLWIVPRGRMAPEFDEAIFNGDINHILGPVKTQYGYHLIWVTERD